MYEKGSVSFLLPTTSLPCCLASDVLLPILKSSSRNALIDLHSLYYEFRKHCPVWCTYCNFVNYFGQDLIHLDKG